MDIVKFTKTTYNEEYKMMFFMNTNYPGDRKPPMVIGYVEGGIMINDKEIDFTKCLKTYRENMEKIVFYDDTLLNKAYETYTKKCVSYMRKAIKDILSKHNSTCTRRGQAHIYGCFLYTGSNRWTGMLNSEEDSVETLNNLYSTEIDDGYIAMEKTEAEELFLDAVANERDQ